MSTDEKIEQLAKMLTEAADKGFTGSIKINFFKGNITNLNREESILV